MKTAKKIAFLKGFLENYGTIFDESRTNAHNGSHEDKKINRKCNSA
jgi:hypothetical protein